MFLTPASQLAIVGVSSNTLIRIVAKGDEASPKAVGKELVSLGLQAATIIASQKAWQTIVKRRLLNPINQAFAVVAIPLVVGGVTSYLIDEEEGLQNYFYAIDMYTDPEVAPQTKTEIVLSNINTIFDFYSGGGKNKKEGFFEFES